MDLDSVERYGTGAIAFHWATVTLVLVVGTLGLLHDSWPSYSQAFWLDIHALTGLLLWVLVLARMCWRVRYPPPAPPEGLSATMRQLSSTVHLLLYGLLVVTPVVGIVTFVYHGRAFELGILRVDPDIKANRAIFHPTQALHGYLAYALFGLATLHVLAALWHHRRNDRLLERMWPAAARRQ